MKYKIVLILFFLFASLLGANDTTAYDSINSSDMKKIQEFIESRQGKSFKDVNVSSKDGKVVFSYQVHSSSSNTTDRNTRYRLLPKYFFAYLFLLSSLIVYLLYKFIAKRNNSLLLENSTKTYIDFDDSQDFSKTQAKLILVLLFFMSIVYVSSVLMILDYFFLDTKLTSSRMVFFLSFLVPYGASPKILFFIVVIGAIVVYKSIQRYPGAKSLILFTYSSIMVFVFSFMGQEIAQNAGLIVAIIMLFTMLIVASYEYKKHKNFDISFLDEKIDIELLNEKNLTHKRKRVQNIIEEISIASAVKMPSIYIINSDSINCMIAANKSSGFSIAITQGALEHLNREELQGMIAHHFGAIYTQSIKISSLIDSLMDGVNFIPNSMISIFMSKDKSIIDFFYFGPMMFLTIFILIFNYILRAVQRSFYKQQKYLFDSYAVEYIRNDSGIIGALKTIKDEKNSSVICENDLGIYTQLFFVQPIGEVNSKSILTVGKEQDFSFHPKIEDRIIALDPSLDERDEEADKDEDYEEYETFDKYEEYHSNYKYDKDKKDYPPLPTF
jgi:Zn-dependent protease with chaperone function